MGKTKQTYKILLTLAEKYDIFVAIVPFREELRSEKVRGIYSYEESDKSPDEYISGHLICIDSGLSLEEKAYTLAHELGHFMNRDRLVGEYWLDRDLYKEIEAEANEYADWLLSYVRRRLNWQPLDMPLFNVYQALYEVDKLTKVAGHAG
jgi:hypothetical protein